MGACQHLGRALLKGEGVTVTLARPVPLAGGCANVALIVAGETGTQQWLLGSVSDDPYDIRTRVVVSREGPHAYVATELQPVAGVGMQSRGYVVAEGERGRGVNDAGFALTWAFVRERKADTTGSSSGDFARGVLAGCATVDEVLEFLEGAERGFSGAFFFADAAGDFAQVEIGRERLEVTARAETMTLPYAVNVNCYQSAAMRPYETESGALEDVTAPNANRLTAAHALLEKLRQPATISDLARVLSDHAGADVVATSDDWVFPSQGYSICNHGSFGGEAVPGAVAFGTVSAEILDPVTRTLWYCYGWPCGANEASADQPLQERSWGRFLPFRLDSLPEGYLTTLHGDLTAAAVRSIDLGDALAAPTATAVPA